MNIRKHWKKVVLSCAAAFWASCSDDSSTQPIQDENPSSSNAKGHSSENSSSSVFIQESSSGTFIGSSSDNAPAPLYGVYYQETVRRANDTTVTCVAKESSAAQQAIYTCSNGEILSEEKTLQKDGLLYTKEEINNLLDPMKIPVNTKEGDKFVFNGDTCEVVSTYSSWFGKATGYNAGTQDGADEASHKIDSLVAENIGKKAKQECLDAIKDQLDRGYAIYGPLPESYPQEIKCSDGVVKETDHYKLRLENFNKGVEEGYNETIARANEMIDECKRK